MLSESIRVSLAATEAASCAETAESVSVSVSTETAEMSASATSVRDNVVDRC